MKRKVIALGVAGLLVLGGTAGISALANGTDDGANKVNKAMTGNTEELISVEEAKEIASKEVEGAYVESVELETEHGVLVYDIDLEYKNSDDDVDVDVNAKTGEVVRVKHDDDKYDDKIQKEKSSQNKSMISLEEAIAIATKDTPGKLAEAEYDDDGYYEIEMYTDGYEVEIKIAASNGEIIKKEIDDKDGND